MAWGERNEKTKYHHIEKTPDGRFAIVIRRKSSKYYRNGLPTIEAALKARNETLKRMAEYDAKHQAETYGELIPFEEQCERCTKPHLPGNRYCEYHDKRRDNYVEGD